MTATKQKKKLCWNCEGSTSFEEANCPFCGVYLSPLSVGGNEQNDSILNPPYKMDAEDEEEQEIPSSPYPQDNENSDSENVDENNEETSEESVQGVLWPLLILSAGFMFTIFSLALLLFSQNGKLILSWNANLWFVYLFLGASLLLVSWKMLNSFQEK